MKVPRVFVNVVEILETEGIRKLKKDTVGCSVLQPLLCPCFINPRDGSPQLDEIRRINREYQIRSSEMIYSGRYNQREDFVVVSQPFFRNTIMPLNDVSINGLW
nr:PREDICTED: phospholipase B1, membrane-associated-like [Latimeria chalumnae]|eukprot:XP_014343310.1 PREDICTED: phospholipase B1, membrane-associated-like [Latimeria chalumnae]